MSRGSPKERSQQGCGNLERVGWKVWQGKHKYMCLLCGVITASNMIDTALNGRCCAAVSAASVALRSSGEQARLLSSC